MFFLFAGPASACSLFTSLDGLSGGSPTLPTEAAAFDVEAADALDARPESGAPPSEGGSGDAGDDGPAPRGPNYFPIGDFELGSSCSGQGYNSSYTLDPIARSGTQSCRVCHAYGQPPNVYSYDKTIDSIGAPPKGSRYYVEAWLRSAPDAAPPTGGAEITLRDFRTTGGTFTAVDERHSGYTRLGSEWTKVAVEFSIADTTDGLDVYVDAPLESGTTCFLLDDVVVQRVY